MPHNIKLTIEYDGAKFYGWQRQPKLKTVQGELDRALQTILPARVERLVASGRTDSGVHALGQVVNFHLPFMPDLFKLSFGISSILRNEVSVVGAEEVSADFHARKSAKAKVYLYRILNRSAMPTLELGRVWHVPQTLNLDFIRREAAALVGKHNFTSFRAIDCTAVSAEKEIFEIKIDDLGQGYLEFRFIGSGFLKQMVRNLVGTLIDSAQGRLDSPSISQILALKDRTQAGQTAPACGLYLEKVIY